MQRKMDSNIINAIPAKPQVLPFSTIEAIQMFTKDNAVYDETVSIELINYNAHKQPLMPICCFLYAHAFYKEYVRCTVKNSKRS